MWVIEILERKFLYLYEKCKYANWRWYFQIFVFFLLQYIMIYRISFFTIKCIWQIGQPKCCKNVGVRKSFKLIRSNLFHKSLQIYLIHFEWLMKILSLGLLIFTQLCKMCFCKFHFQSQLLRYFQNFLKVEYFFP